MTEPTPIPSVAAGRIRLRAQAAGPSVKGTKPEGGTQRTRTPKYQDRRIPSQKIGHRQGQPVIPAEGPGQPGPGMGPGIDPDGQGDDHHDHHGPGPERRVTGKARAMVRETGIPFSIE